MYLIIKDPTARTVRYEYEYGWLPELKTYKADDGLDYIYVLRKGILTPAVMEQESAEETAKSIAIKENLIYTVNPCH